MKLAFDSNIYEARKNETDREYVKSDCADTCTYPRMILNFICSRPSGIQTYDICLFTGAPNVPKNAVFKTWDPKRHLVNSNRFDDSW